MYDLGGKFDKSFNEAAYNGAKRWAEETGDTVAHMVPHGKHLTVHDGDHARTHDVSIRIRHLGDLSCEIGDLDIDDETGSTNNSRRRIRVVGVGVGDPPPTRSNDDG